MNSQLKPQNEEYADMADQLGNKNDMAINYSKTKDMIMGPPSITANLPFINITAWHIERVNSTKLLCRVYTSATCCAQQVSSCAQLVAGNTRNLLRATSNLMRATCCLLPATSCSSAQLVARNLLRWCKRGIIESHLQPIE